MRNFICSLGFTVVGVLGGQTTAYANFDGQIGDYKVVLSSQGEQSKQLNQLIMDVSKRAKGGEISIPAGTYWLSGINLLSNVHINIDKDALIKTYAKGGKSKLKNKKHADVGKSKKGAKPLNVKIFNLTADGSAEVLTNVKIYCGNCTATSDPMDQDNYYSIDLTKDAKTGEFLYVQNARVFTLSNINNFWVSDFFVIDNNTKFSALAMTPTLSGSIDNRVLKNVVSNGVVKNANLINGQYGYGLVQVQAAQDVHFENLHSTGGVALRLESGAGIESLGTYNFKELGRFNNITASNITCTNGKAALMMSPHGRIHGSVTVDGVHANSCGYAATISTGFIDRQLKVNKKNPNPSKYKRGFFEGPVKISNVSAVFGNKAQQKLKNFKYIPNSLKNGKGYEDFPKAPNPSSIINAPSIATLGFYSVSKRGAKANNLVSDSTEGNGEYDVEVNNVTGAGFPECIKQMGYTIYANETNLECK